jgi:hypothetical protein
MRLPPALSTPPPLPSPPPQVPMSQLASLSGGGGGGTLLHEAMSFLRRCLTQVERGGEGGCVRAGRAWQWPVQGDMREACAVAARTSALAALQNPPRAALLCPTQQPEVRCVVYDGLPALLAADPSVQVRSRWRLPPAAWRALHGGRRNLM